MKTSRGLAVGVIVLSLVLAAAVAAVLRGPANAERDAAPEVAYTLLDGRQGTLQALRVLAATATTPAIFMTAKVQRQELEQHRAQGAIGVIPKPFDPMELPAQIRQLCRDSGF